MCNQQDNGGASEKIWRLLERISAFVVYSIFLPGFFFSFSNLRGETNSLSTVIMVPTTILILITFTHQTYQILRQITWQEHNIKSEPSIKQNWSEKNFRAAIIFDWMFRWRNMWFWWWFHQACQNSIKTYQIYTSNTCSLFFVSYTSIELVR